jgi:ABC-type spermidine/putrescine transport system permease subunit II
MYKRKPVLLTIYTVLFFIYIFAPIILIFIFAWNKGEGYNFPLQGITWKWFIELFKDELALKSIKNSIIIAVISATISTIFGTALTFGIIKGISKYKTAYLTLLMLPVLMPSLTIGIAALVFFRTINIPLGIPIVILSHVSISMSYVFLIMMGRIEGLSLDMQEAAVDLGASWFESLKDVIFPVLLPAIIAGWLFSFMISWNEFIVTYFLIGNEVTLPIYIFSQLRFGISPKVNAISVLITLFTLIVILILITSRKVYSRIKSKTI